MGGTGKTKWRPADDVFHLGQLYAILLCGCASSKLTARDVKALACSPEAKSVIQRCIGDRRKRFSNAGKMLAALEKHGKTAPNHGVVRSLKGKHVVFTGPLSIRRKDAERLVRKVGGVVRRRVDHQTNVLVVGGTSPNWKAELKGQKLLDADYERDLGKKIAIVREKQFVNLSHLR